MSRPMLVMLVGLASACWAQEYRSTISGSVRDPQQAVVPGVQILAVQTATGTEFKTVSGESGQFVLPMLPPGNYRITAEAAGFKRYVHENYAIKTNSRPNAIGDPTQSARQPYNWINPAAFAIPTSTQVAAGNFYGNAGYNSIREPGLTNLDFSLLKQVVVREVVRVQFRAEFFNATNTPFFGLPGSVGTEFNSEAFGKVTEAGDPRVVQFGLKLIF